MEEHASRRNGDSAMYHYCLPLRHMSRRSAVAIVLIALTAFTTPLPANAQPQFPGLNCPGQWVNHGAGYLCQCSDGTYASLVGNRVVCGTTNVPVPPPALPVPRASPAQHADCHIQGETCCLPRGFGSQPRQGDEAEADASMRRASGCFALGQRTPACENLWWVHYTTNRRELFDQANTLLNQYCGRRPR